MINNGDNQDDSVGGASGLVDNATSRSYLLGKLTCDMTDCAASTTTMSFEFEFDVSSADFQTLLSDIQTNGIEFDLSPERGGAIDVPAPATLWLMVSGIFMLLATARRRRQIF